MNIRKIAGPVMMAIGVVFIATAWGKLDQNVKIEEESYSFSADMVDELTKKQTEMDVFDEPVFEEKTEDTVITLESGEFIGSIEIPVINVTLPVYNEFSYPNLQLSACKYAGNMVENNAVIAGHSYRKHFGKLWKLKENDLVIFHDASGNKVSYRVVKNEVIHENDMDALMNRENYDLTLFTCKSNHRDRIVVRCVLNEKIC